MSNPNPARITASMWKLWTEFPSTKVKLGGIYARKCLYHDTVENNIRYCGDNYSIRYPSDLKYGPKDKARAIDWTLPDDEMAFFTNKLVAAADRGDPRLLGVREFYGTTDGNNVVGRITDSGYKAFRYATADSSHLWHIHCGLWCAHCDNDLAVTGILSILGVRDGVARLFCVYRDKGEAVKLLQKELVYTFGKDIGSFGPDGDGVDGDYGPATARGLAQVIGGDGKQYLAEEYFEMKKLNQTSLPSTLTGELDLGKFTATFKVNK